VYVGLGVLVGQEQELGHYCVGGDVDDLPVHEDDAVLQQAGEDVVGTLAPAGLLDDHGDEAAGLRLAQ
jgi:hypothetical protein